MSFIEIILLAIGLSMDSMAVSVTGGAVINKCTAGNIFKIASVMGAFQGGMTLLGYLAGMGFASYIEAFDHWIAFFLLLYLGGKMVYDSFCKKEEEESKVDPLHNKILVGLAVATSIDALAVGVSLALLDSSIFLQATTIGIITFGLSGLGVYFGNRVGGKVNLRLDLIGGIILIAIGSKILLEHTIWG
ncbi:MAG: manganese efflux pump MntP family protein [Tannerellaceae bacterium]|nr:manganese efflux pump MntP family protein [Tannerellaceae bacterium]